MPATQPGRRQAELAAHSKCSASLRNYAVLGETLAPPVANRRIDLDFPEYQQCDLFFHDFATIPGISRLECFINISQLYKGVGKVA
jgi:hypothetical protein